MVAPRARRLTWSPVLGRARDFHDFHCVGTFEYAVSDMRRLQNAVARMHDEWIALILIYHADPAPVAIN